MWPASNFFGRVGLLCLSWPTWPIWRTWRTYLRYVALGLLLGSSLSAAAQTPPPTVARSLVAPQALASDYGCMSCHGMVGKRVGPGFAQIAARYQGDAEAATRLTAKIRNGSVGTWGRVIMPRQSKVSEADAQALARWVLSQPPQP